MKLQKRQSNFELLRIVCMFLIVGLHITRQTKMNAYGISDGANYYYSLLIGSAGRLVCNTFVMIGAWFLVDSKFKPERIIAVYIIHQTPAFYEYMWNGIFQVDAAAEAGSAIIGYSLFVIAVIFAVSVCVDNIRLFVWDKLIVKSRVYVMVCRRMQEFYRC